MAGVPNAVTASSPNARHPQPDFPNHEPSISSPGHTRSDSVLRPPRIPQTTNQRALTAAGDWEIELGKAERSVDPNECHSDRNQNQEAGAALKGIIVFRKIDGLKGEGVLQVGHVKKLELRDRLGMTRSVFGRLVNVAERTIAKVEAGDETPEKLKRPYNEVYRLWEALCDLVEPKSIGLWFQTPNESFDGMKPIEVIERGEIDRLWDMVFELQTGMPG